MYRAETFTTKEHPMKRLISVLVMVLSLCAMPAAAQERMSGPVFNGFGSWREVESGLPLVAGTEYKVIFDGTAGADPGDINGRLDSAARFINLLVAHGVPQQKISVAVVFHGPAIWDLTNAAAYGRKHNGAANASAAAVAEMVAQGTKFYVCGQSALAQGINAADLLPGVHMTLSQTVATAQLHAQGYSNIP
jgi:intracellular sulfur oxidation DsrE/DsrF family protein